MSNRLILYSGLGELGGALTEVWDTLHLWQARGMPVEFVTDPPAADLRSRLDGLGQVCDSQAVDRFSAGTTVVGYCNDRFLEKSQQLRRQGCRLVWVNCMTWLFFDE